METGNQHQDHRARVCPGPCLAEGRAPSRCRCVWHEWMSRLKPSSQIIQESPGELTSAGAQVTIPHRFYQHFWGRSSRHQHSIKLLPGHSNVQPKLIIIALAQFLPLPMGTLRPRAKWSSVTRGLVLALLPTA